LTSSDPIISGGGADEAAQAKRAKFIAIAFSAACTLLALWLWLGATPLLVAFLATLAAPAIGVVLVWLSNGRLTWLDVTRKRPSLFAAAFPLLGLFGAIDNWMHIVGGGGLVAILAAVATLMAIGIAYFRKHPADDASSIGMAGLLAAVLSFGLLVIANAAFDGLPRQVYAASVLRTYELHGRGGPYYHLVVGSWADRPSSDLEVTAGLYRNTTDGAVVCAFDHTGALQMRWFYLDKCPPGVPPPKPAPLDN